MINFHALCSYVRGRLTVQKVNLAVDEIMHVVMEKYRILSQAPNKLGSAARVKYQVRFLAWEGEDVP